MSSPTKEKEDKVSPGSPPKGAPPAYDDHDAKTSIGAGTGTRGGAPPVDSEAPPRPEEISALGAPGTREEDVEELAAMFPVIDAAVIEAVLESTGSKELAAEQLLGMTDPSFTPTPLEAHAQRQASLDADFAQALHFQDRDRERAAARFPPPPPAPAYRGAFARRDAQEGRLRDQLAARLDRPQHPPFNPETYVPPYQPRVRKTRAPRHGPGPYDGEFARAQELQARYGEEDVHFTELEKKVLHIAEQGKQTFNTLFTRAKAKYDEYSHDQGQNPPPSGIVAGAQARIGGLNTSPDPHAAFAGSSASSRRWSPSDLEDVEDAQPLSPNAVSGKISPRGGSGTASPSSPNARPSSPNKIDLSKLGFLPKKRVELLSASGDNSVHSPTTPTHPNNGKPAASQAPVSRVSEVSPHQLGDSDDDDDDDLGYTVNPFDKK